MIDKRFTELTDKERVEFFVHCQRLLVAHHPDSPFVVRKNNLRARIEHMKTLLANYKGCVYQDEYVCVLYNYLVVSNPKEPELAVRSRMYQPPDDNYNSVIVDFVVFRELKDCMNFVQVKQNPRIQYVLFARHNSIKVYPTVSLLANVFKVPIVG